MDCHLVTRSMGISRRWRASCFPADRFQDVPQLYLWSYPLLSAGILCLDHALGPGSDIPSTVISVTLKDQLA